MKKQRVFFQTTYAIGKILFNVFILSLQGSISRLIREHAHPGTIFTSSAFRGGLLAGLRSNPASTSNPSSDFTIEHPLLRRQQSTERPNQSGNSRISRVHLLRSDPNRSGHMTHVHVHYSHPHGRSHPQYRSHLQYWSQVTFTR